MRIHQNIPNINAQGKSNKNNKASPDNLGASKLEDSYTKDGVLLDLHSLDRAAPADQGASKSGTTLSAESALKKAQSLKDSILSQSKTAILAQGNIIPQDVLQLA